jgi:hypothetical protein
VARCPATLAVGCRNLWTLPTAWLESSVLQSPHRSSVAAGEAKTRPSGSSVDDYLASRCSAGQLVDCAVNEVWSGLKLVIRKELR